MEYPPNDVESHFIPLVHQLGTVGLSGKGTEDGHQRLDFRVIALAEDPQGLSNLRLCARAIESLTPQQRAQQGHERVPRIECAELRPKDNGRSDLVGATRKPLREVRLSCTVRPLQDHSASVLLAAG